MNLVQFTRLCKRSGESKRFLDYIYHPRIFTMYSTLYNTVSCFLVGDCTISTLWQLLVTTFLLLGSCLCDDSSCTKMDLCRRSRDGKGRKGIIPPPRRNAKQRRSFVRPVRPIACVRTFGKLRQSPALILLLHKTTCKK